MELQAKDKVPRLAIMATGRVLDRVCFDSGSTANYAFPWLMDLPKPLKSI